MATAAGAEAPSSGSFDYGDLATPDRVWLRRAAADLRVRLGRTARESVELGRVLLRARRRLGRGKWEPWLAAEAQVRRRSASRFIAVYKVFGSVDSAAVDRFSLTALYALSEQGVPQSIREYAVEQAGDGASIDCATVEQWLASYRDQTPAPLKLASKDPPKPKPAFDADEVHAAANWKSLGALLVGDNALHLSHATDSENGDLVVTGVLLGPGGRRAASGPTLEAVVLQLVGERREKMCRGACKSMRALDQFSKRQDSPDGRNRYCLDCERERVKKYERMKTQVRKAAGAGPVARPADGSGAT